MTDVVTVKVPALLAAQGFGASDLIVVYQTGGLRRALVSDFVAQFSAGIPVAGTTAGTYAAGNDSRITGAVQAGSLAPVASSGAYADLSGKPTIPTAYNLPPASTTVLGGIKPGTALAVAGDGTLSVSSLAWAQLPAEAQNAPVPASHPGPMTASEILLFVTVNQPTMIAANMAGTAFFARTPPAAAVPLVVSTCHNGTWTTLGTITIATTGAISLPTCAAVTLVFGDTVMVTGPATADTALADFCLNLMLLRV